MKIKVFSIFKKKSNQEISSEEVEGQTIITENSLQLIEPQRGDEIIIDESQIILDTQILDDKKAEEQKLVEQVRIIKEERLAQEEKLAEETRKFEEAQQAEVARLEEVARVEEEERLAEVARVEEEERLAEEKRLAEVARLEEEERITEEKRLAKELTIKLHTKLQSTDLSDKSWKVIQEIQNLPNAIIEPYLDYQEGKLLYPFLSKIGEIQNNVAYLEKLVSSGMLKKNVYEKLLVCPLHPHTFASSIRLYCPDCHLENIEKLKIYEHKKCGHMSESTNFESASDENLQCPSCKQIIKIFAKEIRICGMWYQCNECSKKFDNVLVRLRCRKYKHDFDINSGQLMCTYAYQLKNSMVAAVSDENHIQERLITFLESMNFIVSLDVTIKGKSGNMHKIPVYAKSQFTNDVILIFVKNKSEQITFSDMNSVLVPKLDLPPSTILFVTLSDVDANTEKLAAQYEIKLISKSDMTELFSNVKSFITDWNLQNNGKTNSSFTETEILNGKK